MSHTIGWFTITKKGNCHEKHSQDVLCYGSASGYCFDGECGWLRVRWSARLRHAVVIRTYLRGIRTQPERLDCRLPSLCAAASATDGLLRRAALPPSATARTVSTTPCGTLLGMCGGCYPWPRSRI